MPGIAGSKYGIKKDGVPVTAKDRVVEKLPKLEAIEQVITGLVDAFAEELYSKTQDELEEYWFFKWDDSKSLEGNLYEFYNMLSLYASQCERWEGKHFGSICIVERVRDKYIMPKIIQLAYKIRESAQ